MSRSPFRIVGSALLLLLLTVLACDDGPTDPVDRLGPNVQIQEATVADSTAELVVQAEDDVALDRLTYTLNGGTERPADAEGLEGTTFRISVPGLDVGTTLVTVIAYDESGNTASASTRVTRRAPDTAPPNLSVQSPRSGTQTDTTGVVLRGSASDERGLEGVQYQVDGSSHREIELDSSQSIRFSVPIGGLEPGENSLVVVARDSAGNQAVDTTLVRVDLEAPGLTLGNPEPGSAQDSGKVRLSGSSTDPGGIARIHYRLDEGSEVLVAAQNGDSVSFDRVVTGLASGENRISVVSRDSAGNTKRLERTVIRDTRSPSLSLNDTGETVSLNTTSVTIEGRAEDRGAAGLERVAYTLSGGSETPVDVSAEGEFTLSLEDLPTGTTTLRVTAYDNAGNATESDHTLRVDQGRPQFTVDEPAPGELRGSSAFRLRGSASDPGSVSTLAWRLNGGSLTPLSISPDTVVEFDAELEGLEPGTNRLVVRAEDAAGNRQSDTVSVVRDTVAPELSLTRPDPGASVSTRSVRITGTAQDDRQMEAVTLDLNAQGEVPIAQGDGPTLELDHTVEDLGVGENLLVLRATDEVGNVTRVERTVIRDIYAPEITEVDAPEGDSVSGSEITVTLEVDDPGDVDRITYEINDGQETEADLGGGGALRSDNSSTAALSSESFSFSVGPLAEGENQVILRVYDPAGNTERYEFSVIREGESPTVQIDQPADGASLSSQSATVKGSASDDHQVTRVRYKINDRAPRSVGISPSASVSFEFDATLDPGQNEIKVTASDAAEHRSAASIQVTAPTASDPPALNLTSPADGATVMSSPVTVQGTATDDDQVDQVQYRANGGPLQSVSITPSDNVNLSFNLTLTPGSNTLEVVATDSDGQSTTSSRTVAFAQKPTASFNTGGSTQAGQATTFDATGSSDPLGLSLVYSWEFGDGVRGGSTMMSHIYSSAGTYTARLIVTNSFKADTTTRTLSISAPPAPTATNGTVTGTVKDGSGNDLSGVSVSQVDGSLSGTTGSNGEVTLNGVPVDVPVVFDLSRSGFVSKRVRVQISSSGGSTSFNARLLARAAPVTIPDAENGGSATGGDGTSVEVNANTLVDANGDPVTGDVDASLTPVDVSGSDIEAFPGDFSGVDSQGNTGGLQSFGVADFTLSQGGQELNLAPGETATITIPIYTGGASVGQTIDLWSLNEASGRWVQEGTGTVVSSSGSPTGLALQATIGHLSPWNADVLFDRWNGDLECLDGLGNPVGCTVTAVTADDSGPRTYIGVFVPSGGSVEAFPPNESMDVQARAPGFTTVSTTITTGSAGGQETLTFNLNRPPSASFGFTPSDPAPGQSITFDASGSNDPDGSIVEYRWDFTGDGTVEATTSSPTASHTFSSSDSHLVTLTVVDDDGATDVLIRGVNVNQAPSASFTFSPSPPTVGQPASFDASGSSDPDGSVAEYRWDFTGDGTVDATTSSPTTSHTFSSSGAHTVTLTVVDDDGATTSTTNTVDATEAPSASFTFSPSVPVVGQSVTFDASGSSDPDGSIAEYRWDFTGDGTIDATSSNPTTSHAFSSGGAHTVTLTVADDEGATASTSSILNVNQAPSASFTFNPSPPTVGQSVTFDASGSSDPDGSVTEYRWDFTGDGTVDATTFSPTTSHTFSSSGTHTVTLTVVDDEGGTASTSGTLNVNQAPSASFTFSPSNPAPGESVTFDASGSGDPDGSIAEYRWDFTGDGNPDVTSSSATASHTFSSSAAHPVGLTVVDDDGATDFTVGTVNVNEAPSAAFTFTPSNPSIGQSVSFDASGSGDPDGSIAEYRWDFTGDGSIDATSSSATTTNSFSSSGSHAVTLTVVDDDGATSSTTRTVDVGANQAPMASFTFSPSDPSVGESISFDASGSSDPDGTISQYGWDFDEDGMLDVTTSSATTSHTFTSAGEHSVTLVVMDDDGATDFTTKIVTVSP